MGIYEKGKGNNYIKRRKVFLLVQIAQHSDVNSNYFNFQSSIHQFSSHNNSFLAYFSNSFLLRGWIKLLRPSTKVILPYF